MIEKILGVLDAHQPHARILCVQIAQPGQTPTLEFRHQRMCGDMGWTTQKRITMASGQFELLKGMLNLMDMDARQAVSKPSKSCNFLQLVGA